jgi:hypothetical protein
MNITYSTKIQDNMTVEDMEEKGFQGMEPDAGLGKFL